MGIPFKNFQNLKVCHIEKGWDLFCVSPLDKASIMEVSFTTIANTELLNRLPKT